MARNRLRGLLASVVMVVALIGPAAPAKAATSLCGYLTIGLVQGHINDNRPILLACWSDEPYEVSFTGTAKLPLPAVVQITDAAEGTVASPYQALLGDFAPSRTVTVAKTLRVDPARIKVIDDCTKCQAVQPSATPTRTRTPTPTPVPTLAPTPTRTRTPIPVQPSATAAPTPTRRPPTATPVPTAGAPRLVMLPTEYSSRVGRYSPARVILNVDNQGGPMPSPFWQYSGAADLLNSQGRILESHTFQRGEASTLLPRLVDGKLSTSAWEMRITLRFANVVDKGKLRIRLTPTAYPGAITEVLLDMSVLETASVEVCASTVLNKLWGPFASDLGKDAMDAGAAEIRMLACPDGDVKCAVKPVVTAFLKIAGRAVFNTPGKVIAGIWGVFDTDALNSCRDPVGWMWSLVAEFQRQGVPVDGRAAHSPVTLVVTDAAGRVSGLFGGDDAINEIPGARVMEWNGDKYVIYPSQDVKTEAVGTASGAVKLEALSLVNGKTQSGDFSIAGVTAGSRLVMPAGSATLEVDMNADGVTDARMAPPATPAQGATVPVAPPGQATALSSAGLAPVAALACLGLLGAVGLGLMIAGAVLLARRRGP